jgi:formylmethanofuran dehydrogenase subunit E
MSTQYPTAICKECGEPIYKSEGTPNKKGEWVCFGCEEKKEKE